MDSDFCVSFKCNNAPEPQNLKRVILVDCKINESSNASYNNPPITFAGCKNIEVVYIEIVTKNCQQFLNAENAAGINAQILTIWVLAAEISKAPVETAEKVDVVKKFAARNNLSNEVALEALLKANIDTAQFVKDN